MLKDEDRIFKNLYNDLGSDIESSQKRGDWSNTKDIIKKGTLIIGSNKNLVIYMIKNNCSINTTCKSGRKFEWGLWNT